MGTLTGTGTMPRGHAAVPGTRYGKDYLHTTGTGSRRVEVTMTGWEHILLAGLLI